MLFRSIFLLAALYNCADAFVVRGSSRPQVTSLNAAAKKAAPKKKEALESLRKKEFVAVMAEELGYTKTDAEAALTCALDIISDVSNLRVCAFLFGVFGVLLSVCRCVREQNSGL